MIVYKICPEPMWREAERTGVFRGAPVDLADGFIHLSTASQLSETASRHFAGQSGLLLVAIPGAALGAALRFEPSRGGALFPHLYGPLPVAVATDISPLPLGSDGLHVLPDRALDERLDPAALGWRLRAGDGGFIDLVGPLWEPPDGARERSGFLAEARHLNRGGLVHGGMLMTFVDQALGIAAWSVNGNRPQVTIQLDTHFISGVKVGEFVEARCRVVRMTRALLFMSGELAVGDRIVATANGVWKMREVESRRTSPG